MKAHQAEHKIATMCRVLRLSRSGYYAWLDRDPSQHAQRDEDLLEEIRVICQRSRGTYGAPRVHAELRASGWAVGKKRVARLMRQDGLSGVTRRRYVTTTQRGTGRPAPDLVERQFKADGPNELWVADITYVPTLKGFLYLAVVLDVWSRRVVGWAMDTHMQTELVEQALDMAIGQRRPTHSVIHHSDQGSQYTSTRFGLRAVQHDVRLSMGSVGDCYDNALAESFFATLECELIDRNLFESPQQARLAVFDFIEGFYNTTRRHSALGYLSPKAFEDQSVQLAAK